MTQDEFNEACNREPIHVTHEEVIYVTDTKVSETGEWVNGYPKSGTACEAKEHANSSYKLAECLPGMYHGKCCFAGLQMSGELDGSLFWSDMFRPLQPTKEQLEADKKNKAIISAQELYTDGHVAPTPNQLGVLYDAGKLNITK